MLISTNRYRLENLIFDVLFAFTESMGKLLSWYNDSKRICSTYYGTILFNIIILFSIISLILLISFNVELFISRDNNVPPEDRIMLTSKMYKIFSKN